MTPSDPKRDEAIELAESINTFCAEQIENRLKIIIADLTSEKIMMLLESQAKELAAARAKIAELEHK